jgi:hypothetical protein
LPVPLHVEPGVGKVDVDLERTVQAVTFNGVRAAVVFAAAACGGLKATERANNS